MFTYIMTPDVMLLKLQMVTLHLIAHLKKPNVSLTWVNSIQYCINKEFFEL